jgi:hypothetical protein
MISIEKSRVITVTALLALTLAAFMFLKLQNPSIGHVASESDETAGNCGTCTGQDGKSHTCNLNSKKYTCTAQTQFCASNCVP